MFETVAARNQAIEGHLAFLVPAQIHREITVGIGRPETAAILLLFFHELIRIECDLIRRNTDQHRHATVIVGTHATAAGRRQDLFTGFPHADGIERVIHTTIGQFANGLDRVDVARGINGVGRAKAARELKLVLGKINRNHRIRFQ